MSRTAPITGSWRLFGPALALWAAAAALIHEPGSARIIALTLMVAVGVFASVWLAWRGALGLAWRGALRRSTKPNPQSSAESGDGKTSVKRIGVGGAVFLLIGLMLLLCTRIDAGETARNDPALVAAAESRTSARLDVTLTGYPDAITSLSGEPRSRVHVKICAADAAPLASCVPGVAWLAGNPPGHWAPGTPLVLTSTLVPTSPEKHAAYELRVRSYTDVPAETYAISGIQARFGSLAAQLRSGLRTAAQTIDGAALVPGFAVGDTALVTEELEDLMVEASLSHLVAVSGSNVSLVIVLVTWAASWCGAGRRLRITLAAFGLAGFVAVVGPDASVQRAAVMAGVLLASNFGGKRARALPALGLAVIGMLFANPWQAIQPGFALSVAATAGILLFNPTAEAWIRTRLRLPKLMSLPIAITCVAQVAVAPFLLLLQPGIPMGGLIANVLAAPAAPIGTGLGLAALLLLPVSASLGTMIVWAASWAARWVEAAGALALLLPGSRWYWPGGWGGALTLAGVEACALLAILLAAGKITDRAGFAVPLKMPWRGRTGVSPQLALGMKILAGLTAGIIAAMVIVVPLGVRGSIPTRWFVAACDVGQGDAVLIRNPDSPDQVILVDTGDDPAKLLACLELFRVKTIALLLLTHDHRDHIGAVSAVLHRSTAVLVSPAAKEQGDERPLLAQLNAAAVPWRVGKAGDYGHFTGGDGSLTWEILAPIADVAPDTTNSASLVLLVESQGQKILLLGDTGEAEQRALSREYPGLQADVVKVAHHGSRDQFFSLYDTIGAQVGLISVGDNRYGHPTKATLDALTLARTTIYRTDELGSVALEIEGGTMRPWAAGELSSVMAGG